MATTATSTLILAIEARNETREAFASVSRDLSEQTAATQRAAREQTTVVREATAQQLLELRQRAQYEAQAIREGAAGADAATKRASRERILMLQQDAAQTALLARQGADAQIRAINETRDADLSALRDRADQTKLTMQDEVDAARIAAREEATALREGALSAGAPLGGAGEEEAAGRRRRGVGGLPLVGGLTESAGGLVQMTGMLALWNLGYAAINRMTEAVGGFASGLVTANASLEQYNMTLQAIYGSSQRAAEASSWIDQFAEKTPFTRDATRQAALTIASLGDNVSAVLPAVGNLAAIMGVDLPRAAQAFSDAQQGRFESLQQTLRTTKGELVAYGLQLDSSGHVLNNSFVPAFERYVAARFPNAMALQMQTFTGSMSNVQDAFQLLQRTMGKPLFDVLKGQLAGLYAFLNRPDVEAWAARAGAAIGQAASGIIAWVGRMLPYFLQLAPIIGQALSAVGDAIGLLGALFAGALPYIVGVAQAMVNAWQGASPLVGRAIGVIMGVAQAMGTFIHDQVFPVIKEALDRAAQWWRDHADNVAKVVSAIVTVVLAFIGNLGTNMRAGFDILHGIWLAGWGLLTGVVGLAIDAMTGNWTSFGKDLSDMSTQIADGIVYIFEGMVIKMISLLAGLKDPINAVLHAEYQASIAWGTVLGDVFESIQGLIDRTINGMIDGIRRVLGTFATGPLGVVLRGVSPALGMGLLAAYEKVSAMQPLGVGSLGDLLSAIKGRLSIDQMPGSGVSAAQLSHEKAMIAWVQAAYVHGDSLQTFIQGLKARVGIDQLAGSAVSPDQLAMERDLLSRAEKLQAGKDAELPPFAFGLPPQAEITFNVDPKEAVQAAIDKANETIANIQAKPNPFTGIVTHYGDQTLTDTKGGKGFWDGLMDDIKKLKAQGINLPKVTLKDLYNLPAVDLTPPGGGDLFDPRSAEAALKAAKTAADRRLAEARATLDLYVESGKATVPGGLKDVRAVIAAEQALPPSERPGPAQLALEAFNLTRGVYERVLAQMQKHIDVDIKNHVDIKKLQQEEAAYLKVMAREPGITPTDLAAAKQALDAAIGVSAVTKGGPIAPVPRYGALAGETGYGQTVVSFGGAQANPWQSMVAALREQITHLRAQLAKDDQLIALLEVGNATGNQQLGVLRSIDGHVIPGPPTPAHSVNSHLKARGGFALTGRT